MKSKLNLEIVFFVFCGAYPAGLKMTTIQVFYKEVALTKFSFPFHHSSFTPLCHPTISKVPELFLNISGTGESAT